MTVEEKISHIREAAMEEARARGNEIIDQHQKALEGVFKTHKQEAVRQIRGSRPKQHRQGSS